MPLDKLNLLLLEKQRELQSLQTALKEALTGVEAPDYELAALLQPLINNLKFDIQRLEKLLSVGDTPRPFSFYLSRLMSDNTVTRLELWTGIRGSWDDVTVHLLTIRKLASPGSITCKLRFTELVEGHLYSHYTTRHLQHIGWSAGRGGKTFWFKAIIKSPGQFDAFVQCMAVTMLEVLEPLWGRSLQYYRFR